jgi:HK97 family phage prohead protease
MVPQPDFSGWATKYGLKCTDGRVILKGAFAHNNGAMIPLVWQHQQNTPTNVLGHVILEHQDEGVRAHGYFNQTAEGQHAKQLVYHGDISKLSIYANRLKETPRKEVQHGEIREASLVMAGANPGAVITDVYVQHGDDLVPVEGEIVIYLGDDEVIKHSDDLQHAGDPAGNVDDHTDDNEEAQDEGLDDNDDISIADVFESMSPLQQQAVHALVGAAMEHSDELNHSAADGLNEDSTANDVFETLNEVQKNTVFALIGAALEHSANDKEGGSAVTDTHRNVFDQTGAAPAVGQPSSWKSLQHAEEAQKEIFAAARSGGSLKAAVMEYGLAHNINDISTLFPYDQPVTDTPEWITRRMEWVAAVLNGVHKTPFSRIRSWTANLTFDDARAKGYIKGNIKKEQFFEVAKRTTSPQTVYKKQKLDRDDILDITEFDVVQWLQSELRIMLDEELARAILVGDGRDIDDDDKINPANVRPILGDDALYVTNLEVDLTSSGTSADDIVDAVVTGMRYYRGSGNPVMYTTLPYLSKLLLVKDTLGRRLYANRGEVASAMGIADIIPCEALEATPGLIGIIVNLTDYTVGQDKGGQVSMFDFFDIDYNQQKYLIETRLSGAMTKYRGAITIQEFTGGGGILPDPTVPTFNTSTGVVTIPVTSHVTYVVVDDTDGSEGSTLSSGAQSAISSGATVHIRAKAASTYVFVDDQSNDWHFTRS